MSRSILKVFPPCTTWFGEDVKSLVLWSQNLCWSPEVTHDMYS